jgi:hypothetical protein
MEKEDFQVEILERFLQIRRKFYDDSNRKMASAIGENEKNLSSMLCGSRNIGLTSILKLLNANPEIDANWLLGRIPSPEPKPYTHDEEETSSLVAAEEPEPYGITTIADLRRENDRLWQRYDEAQQLIGSLRAELKAVKDRAADYAKEKTVSSGITTLAEA